MTTPSGRNRLEVEGLRRDRETPDPFLFTGFDSRTSPPVCFRGEKFTIVGRVACYQEPSAPPAHCHLSSFHPLLIVVYWR